MSTTLAKEWSAKAVEPGRDYFPEINNSAINSMSESTVSVDPGALAANEDSYEAINEIRRDSKQAEVRDELWRQQKGITKSGAVAGGSSSQEAAARLRRREREHFQRVMDVMTQVEQQRLAAWRQEQTSFKGMNMTNEELSAFFDEFFKDPDKVLQHWVDEGYIDESEKESVYAIMVEVDEIHRLEAEYAARGEPISDELQQRIERVQDKPEYDRMRAIISEGQALRQENDHEHHSVQDHLEAYDDTYFDGFSVDSLDDLFSSGTDFAAGSAAAGLVYGAEMAHVDRISSSFSMAANPDAAMTANETINDHNGSDVDHNRQTAHANLGQTPGL